MKRVTHVVCCMRELVAFCPCVFSYGKKLDGKYFIPTIQYKIYIAPYVKRAGKQVQFKGAFDSSRSAIFC